MVPVIQNCFYINSFGHKKRVRKFDLYVVLVVKSQVVRRTGSENKMKSRYFQCTGSKSRVVRVALVVKFELCVALVVQVHGYVSISHN